MAQQPLDFLLGIELSNDLKVKQVATSSSHVGQPGWAQKGLLLAFLGVARYRMTHPECPPDNSLYLLPPHDIQPAARLGGMHTQAPLAL